MELPSTYQAIIHRSRYSRFLPEQNRRETYVETIDRYINFMYKKVKDNPKVSDDDLKYIYDVLGATCER